MEAQMSWTEITRAQYRREGLSCASDVNDAEWLLLSFFLPAPCHVGRPREVDLRKVVNAILFVLSTGCQWRALPPVFPPYSTVQYYFYLWRDQRAVAADQSGAGAARPQSRRTQHCPIARGD
jgi:putative transposase